MMTLSLTLLMMIGLLGCSEEMDGREVSFSSRHGSGFTKSLYYYGSSPTHHYFRQLIRPFAIIGSGSDALKVPQNQLQIPEEIRFPYYVKYRNLRLKVRISEEKPYRVRLRDKDNLKTKANLKEIQRIQKQLSLQGK